MKKKIKNVSAMVDIYNKLIETEITYLDSEQLKNTEFINKIYSSIGRVNSKLLKLYYCSEGILQGNEKTINEDTEHDSCKIKIFLKKIMHIKKFCDSRF